MLSHLAGEVHIIHRRDRFRAQEYLTGCAMSEPNIKIIWDTVVERIEGEEGVTGLALKNLKTGERSTLPVEGVFIYVGVKPISDLVKGLVELTEDGYIRAGEDTRTSVPGIFAAGDVRQKPSRQITTAVADGANAVHAAGLYFIERGLSCRYA